MEMGTMMNNKLREKYRSYQQDWNKFARDIFNVRLDSDQQRILEAMQHHRRVSVRSGNARGKDFVAATSALCFLYLNVSSKVIMTAPTERQAIKIMMSEITKIHRNAKIPLGGEILQNQIKFSRPDWHLLAFKSSDYKPEAWTGFHSPNLMVIVTEASGVEQLVFEGIESILTGNSRLLIVFNPNRNAGEAYNSVKSPLYEKFKLSCLDAPNVKARKTIIPGQVDYDWVEERVRKWCVPISPPVDHENDDGSDQSKIQCTADHDFKFNQQWYRPNDLFRIKVMGEFPETSEDQLIPLAWIEAANQRWNEWQHELVTADLKLGVDVAGMGSDLTVFCHRYQDFVKRFQTFQRKDHMAVVGEVKQILSARDKATAFIDTIGEGAGVYSRLKEQKMNVTSVKFSEAARLRNSKKDLTDFTEQRTFANMRAYCYWAIRDALDPQCGANLALPPLDEFTQDLTEPRWSFRSDGKILIEEKSEIKKRLGRSPDFGDALALTFYPVPKPFYWPQLDQSPTVHSVTPGWGDRTNYLIQPALDDFEWNMENWELLQRGILRGRSTIRSIK
jgi:hypothetical protein